MTTDPTVTRTDALDITKRNIPGKRPRPGTPWRWIPTVYIAEGLPYFAVNTLTVLMYTNLGVSLRDMAYYTGWLYLPWVIKPFWSPFVDIIGTKRGWVTCMQLTIGIAMAAVAFCLPSGGFFALTLAAFWLMAFASATHDIAADGYYMLALDKRDQAAYVGVRSTFYRVASVIGQGGLVMLAGYLEKSTGDIPVAWAVVFASLSVFFLIVSLYHSRFMPHAAADRPNRDMTAGGILHGFGKSFATFFSKPGITVALLFMLLYRLPEALCIKLIQPFLVATRADGGLGLSTAQVGFVNGTVGVVALLAGGILGGLAVARGGLRRWLWPMALSLTLPCAFYCLMAYTQPVSFTWICTAVGLEQFGYGFGFTAFMMYLMYFSAGSMSTSHYAFCTAFMALGMMLPGMAAGAIHDALATINPAAADGPAGYINFFWLVMISCIATFGVTLAVRRQIPAEE